MKFEIVHQQHYICDRLIEPGSIVELDGYTGPEDDKTLRRPPKILWTFKGEPELLWNGVPSMNMVPLDDEAKTAWVKKWGKSEKPVNPVEKLAMTGGHGNDRAA